MRTKLVALITSALVVGGSNAVLAQTNSGNQGWHGSHDNQVLNREEMPSQGTQGPLTGPNYAGAQSYPSQGASRSASSDRQTLGNGYGAQNPGDDSMSGPSRSSERAKLRQELRRAGFQKIRIRDAAFLVEAQTEDGDRVMMVVNPPGGASLSTATQRPSASPDQDARTASSFSTPTRYGSPTYRPPSQINVVGQSGGSESGGGQNN
jgi:hypothetical protein